MNLAAIRRRLQQLEEAAQLKNAGVNFWDLLTASVAADGFKPENIELPMKDGVVVDLWDFVHGKVKADNMVREEIANWHELGPKFEESANYPRRDIDEEIAASLCPEEIAALSY